MDKNAKDAKMTNIEKFDLYAGKILATLYEEFPVRKNLHYLSDFGDDVDGRIFASTLEWLIDSDFIECRNQTLDDDLIIGARLTLKGLELLKQKPKTLQKSFGESLKEYAKKGIDAGITATANDILSSSFAFVSKLMQ